MRVTSRTPFLHVIRSMGSAGQIMSLPDKIIITAVCIRRSYWPEPNNARDIDVELRLSVRMPPEIKSLVAIRFNEGIGRLRRLW